MASVVGQRRTDNILAAQRVIDMGSEILLLQPDAAPLTVVLKRIYEGGRSRAARDTKFSWLEDDLFSRTGVVDGAHLAGDDPINVDDGSIFPAESLALNTSTGEIIYIESVTANALDVIRGASGTTDQNMADDDVLYILGVADSEGDTSQPAHTQNPTQVDNYTQIFKKSVEQSGSRLSSDNVVSQHDWDHQRRKTAIEHLEDIELAMLTGEPSAQSVTPASGYGDTRTTGGVRHFVTENVTSAIGTLTEPVWETWMRTLFRYGASKKTLFCSPIVISALNGFSSSDLRTSVGDESYGVKVMNLMTAHGEVALVKHNLLGDVAPGEAIAVDFANGNVEYRYLGAGPDGSRDTKLLTERQAPDADARKEEWITECGLQFGLPKVHGALQGVTG